MNGHHLVGEKPEAEHTAYIVSHNSRLMTQILVEHLTHFR
jgi:hypothetical protein